TVGGDVKVGDTVTLTLGDGTIASTTVIDLGDGLLGFTVDVDASVLADAGSNSITASVTTSDSAGNSTTATDSEDYGVDTTAPEASIDLNPIVVGDDNVINQAESEGTVTLTGTVGGDVKVGDTVTLTLGDGTIATTTVIDLGDGLLGFTVDVDASVLADAGSNSITASVTTTDAAGNSTTATDKEGYSVDTTPAPAPLVEFQGAGADDIYNIDEIGIDGTVTAKI
ncbi:Ig-like domain-containing protein, partial [Shewanella submarina]